VQRLASWIETVHAIISLLIALAWPAAVYFINGSFEPWSLVLGAASGLSYWYFLSPIP
jgi:hypothetical protein